MTGGPFVWIGVDDTDTLDTAGTNQLARALVIRIAARYRCLRIVRHQLLDDPRIPYTSHNGSASILLEPLEFRDDSSGISIDPWLIEQLKHGMQECYAEGSDPGLCIANHVSEELTQFGLCCQRDVVNQSLARELAASQGIYLEGLGGTEGGVIGALAAVALGAAGNDGRIIQWQGWPDDLGYVQRIELLAGRQIETRNIETGTPVERGTVDLGKHLRPNLRKNRAVLFVQPNLRHGALSADWEALKLH